MVRAEGERLVGKLVVAHTGFWGTYAGTLLEIVPGTRPWRGKIRVEMVLRPALDGYAQNCGGWRERVSFEEGREFDASGGTGSIKLFEGTALPYRDSLVRALRFEGESAIRALADPKHGHAMSMILKNADRELRKLGEDGYDLQAEYDKARPRAPMGAEETRR